MFENINSKKQGDIGLSMAIAYFSYKRYTINIPLTDSQGYDLVIEKEGVFFRVQVKTTKQKNKNKIYKVELRTKGGNKYSEKTKNISKLESDLIFILTEDKQMYCIDTNEIDKFTGINLGEKYNKFLVTF